MNWESKVKKLGTVRPHSKQKVVFKTTKELDISTVTTGCGCTVPTFTPNDVTVVYTPASIPVHLRHLQEQNVTKRVTVHYKDGTNEVLSIKATIKN